MPWLKPALQLAAQYVVVSPNSVVKLNPQASTLHLPARWPWAENAAKFLKKGRPVAIDGPIGLERMDR